VGPVALRGRDLLREIAMERELTIVSGKVARDHIHLLIAHRPHQSISPIVQ
jgi:putative transposase